MLLQMPIIRFLCLHLLMWICLSCERRDYTDLCPKGWKVVRDQCWAPLSYTGPCAAVANLADFTESMKRGFETRCALQWPCEEKCEADYSIDCPSGWLSMGEGLCEAPLDYSYNCLKRVRMVSEGFKREFETACGATWPCQKSCDEDFGQQCPEAWQLSPSGVCEAMPHSYYGTCPPFANLNDFTREEKKLFAALCGVQFPCVDTTPISSCELMETTCPSGWEEKGSLETICVGAGYQGPCRPLIKLDDLVAIGRQAFMETCDVHWPCKPVQAAPGRSVIHPLARIPSGPVDKDGMVVDATESNA